jgi:hypothetical protein
MYKTTIFNWNIFNCPYPKNISIYSAPELWENLMCNKRASGNKLDAECPTISMTSKIIKIYEHHIYDEIAVLETNNSRYFLYGPPSNCMLYYLKEKDIIIPTIWNGRKIANIIKNIIKK